MSERTSTPQDARSAPRKPFLIYRRVALSLEAFDRLKAWQRRLELAEGRPLTNGEVIDAVILSIPYP